MAEHEQYSPQRELLATLLERVDRDTYPSSTHLDMIESLLAPDDEPRYLEILMSRIRSDPFPSISLMKRVQSFA